MRQEIKILSRGKVRKADCNGNDVGIKQDRVIKVEKLFGMPQVRVYNSRRVSR